MLSTKVENCILTNNISQPRVPFKPFNLIADNETQSKIISQPLQEKEFILDLVDEHLRNDLVVSPDCIHSRVLYNIDKLLKELFFI